MARILWLPGVLRAAGLDVVEEPGWRTRGRDDFAPYGLIAHATAGGLQQSNASALGVIVNGRPGLSGPIGHAMIERHTGRWRIVASGAGNHAKTGWAGPLKGHGNRTLIGVECHHNNLDEPWSSAVYQSYVTGFAAICRAMGWNPATRIAAHKEHQPGEKTDPTFNPSTFRANVRQALNGISTPGGPDMQADERNWLANTYQALFNGGPSMGDPVPDPVLDSSRGNALVDLLQHTRREVEALRAQVAELEARPDATITLGPEVAEDLGPVVEAAVRRVLGGLDGAVPPGQ